MEPGRGQPVRATVTGYLRTEVYRHDGGVLWRRSPGPMRPERFRVVPGAVRTAVDGLATARFQMTPGEVSGDARLYAVQRPAPIFLDLVGDPTRRDWDSARRHLGNLGAGLRRLHRVAPLVGGLAPPAGALRLAAWLDGRAGGDAAGRLLEVFAERLGDDRRAALLSWCREACAPAPGHTLLHGAPSLGAAVASAEDDATALLFGEEVAVGPPEYDVAWLLGELRELRLLHFTAEEQRAACGVAETALLDGYGTTGLDFPALRRLTAVRVATHAHDYAAYVGWTDQLVRYADAVAFLVDP